MPTGASADKLPTGQDTIAKAMRSKCDVAGTDIMFDSCETAETIW